jgi:hypothetical protein
MNALTRLAPPHTTPGLLAQQQALLDALWAPVVTNAPENIAVCALFESARGLKAYQSNGHALAERVLVAAYPVVTEVISPDSMGQLARALWHAHPPTRGDLAWWGDALPAFMAASPQLADLPWLPDLARLEWALHTAQAAADAAAPADGLASLQRLASDEPATLRLTWAAATRVLALDWDVWPIWQAHVLAHVQADPEAHTQAIKALGPDATHWAAPRPTPVLLWRPVHAVRSQPLPPDTARFVQTLLDGASLLTALEQADPGFAHWLPQALQQGLVTGVATLATP